MKKINIKSQEEKVNNFLKGFIATHLINIGNKLGLFEAFNNAKEGVTISDLASKLKLNEPYLKIWCQTAYNLEILDCDSHGKFKFQPFLDEILGDKSHFRNMLGQINLAVNVTGERLKISPEYYKKGTIIESYTPERSVIVAESTKRLHFFLNNYFKMLPNNDPIKQMLEQGIKFLDIGCGRGSFIIQLAQMFKNCTFVGIDPIHHGIEVAKNTISQLGLDDRVSVKCLEGEELPYNDEFDIVCMIVTFHEIFPDVRIKVVENAYGALKSNGRLLIFDFSYPEKLEDFRNPKFELGIIDQFNETCLGVIHLNTQEQNKLFTEIGFKEIQRMMISGIDFIRASK